MNLTDIELFLHITDSNSITKASERMNFSQSTVSYRLKLLEKELGVQLFHRNRGNRTTELTLQGERFIPIARQWLAIYRDTQSLKFLPDKVLTITTIDSVSSSLLPHVYRAVSRGDNPLRLRIITHQSAEIYDLVEKRIADIGFTAIPSQRKNVVTTPLFTQKFYVVRYCEHPVPPRKLSPQSLDPEYEIYQSWGGDYDRWHEYLWGPLTRYYIWIDTVSLLQQFLTDEKYWSILPDASLQQLMASLRSVQIDELDPPEEYNRVCYIIKHKSPKPSCLESMEIFEKQLRDYLKKIGKN